MNALKTGAYSKQFSLLGKLIAQDPTVRAVLLNIAARAERKFKDANEVAAYLLTRWAERVEDMAEAKYASNGRRRRGKATASRSGRGQPVKQLCEQRSAIVGSTARPIPARGFPKKPPQR